MEIILGTVNSTVRRLIVVDDRAIPVLDEPVM